MAVFGKKNQSNATVDEADFVRIPTGTQICPGADGKLKMSFAGDMSFGESLPELSELICGRNLSIDPGVTIKASIVKVSASLEMEEGSEIITNELEVDRLQGRKAKIQARTINAGQIELEGSSVIADRVTARESVFIDRGRHEIGTVMAQSLTVTKGTEANILIAEVPKLDGFIPKGGYESFGELLAKVYKYHPEILNDTFSAEARRDGQPAAAVTAAVGKAAVPVPADSASAPAQPQAPVNLPMLGKQLGGLFASKETPKEVSELVKALQANRLDDAKRFLTPSYQKVSSQGKMPEPLIEVFREVQKALQGDSRKSGEAKQSAAQS